MAGAIGLSMLLPAPSAHATGYSPNVGQGADIVMKELRWPRWDQGTYYCFWYINFFPNRYCTFYGGVATRGNKAPPGMFMSYWGGITNIHEGEHFYRHGYGAEGAKGGANGRPPFLRAGSWYRMVLRVFPPARGNDKETYIGWWVKDVDSSEWHTHSIVSIPLRETGVMGNSGFVEALAPESIQRAFERRLGYYRLDGRWHKSNKVGTQNPSQFRLIEQDTVLRFDRPVESDTGTRKEKAYITAVQPDSPVLDAPAVERAEAHAWGNQVTVRWSIPRSASPQLAYKIEVFARPGAEGPRLAVLEDSAPHVQARRLDTDRPPKSVRLTVTDIFDQKASVTIPVDEAMLAPAAEASAPRAGLAYRYYEAPADAQWTRLPDLAGLEPVMRGCVRALDDTVRQDRDKLYALRYAGYLRAPADGLYVLSIGTCDGSRLSIGGKVVAETDGIHSTSVRQYPVALSKGLHAFEILYFKGAQAYLADRILAAWEGPGFESRTLAQGDFASADGADVPSITLDLGGCAAEGVLEDNLVDVRARIRQRGHRIDKVQLLCGRQLLQAVAGTGAAPGGDVSFRVLLPEGDNAVWARLWYDGNSSVESSVLDLKTRNRTEGPWKFDVLGEDVFPLGARYGDGRLSFAGEGFCFAHQRVTGDFRLTGRIAEIALTTKENGVHEANWLGLYVKDEKLDSPFGGDCFGIYRTAGRGMRGPADFPDLAGSRLSIASFPESHRWLRVVRRGKRFQGFTSADGKSWVKAMERIIPRFPGEAHVGVVFQSVPGKSRSLFAGAMDHVALDVGNVAEEPRSRPPAEDLPRANQVTALVQAWEDPRVLYARSNGAGLLKSTDRGQGWHHVDGDLASPDALAVRSAAVHPKDSSIVLRAGGCVVDGALKSGLWKSADGGRTWRLITREIDFDGRGPTATFGEVISFCPQDPNLVAAGGETSGLFLSADAGETWQRAGLPGQRITCLGFVPITRDKVGNLVVGTVADDEFVTLGLGKVVSPGKAPGRIYAVSLRDGKARTAVQCELEDFGVTNIAFDTHENFMNFATTRGVFYTWIHGLVFSQRLHDMPADVLFTAIGSGPHADWSAATYAAPFSAAAPSPVHVTRDRSRNWAVVSPGARATGTDGTLRLSAGVSCILPDREEKDTLYLCNQLGVFKSTDGGASYSLVYRNPRRG